MSFLNPEAAAMKLKNRITDLFSGIDKKMLSIFFTAGYPGLKDTVEICQTLEKSGVDLVSGVRNASCVRNGETGYT